MPFRNPLRGRFPVGGRHAARYATIPKIVQVKILTPARNPLDLPVSVAVSFPDSWTAGPCVCLVTRLLSGVFRIA